MRLRPSIEAAGLSPDVVGARQPLPKTARSGTLRCDTRERDTQVCVNRTRLFVPAKRLVTTLMLHGG